MSTNADNDGDPKPKGANLHSPRLASRPNSVGNNPAREHPSHRNDSAHYNQDVSTCAPKVVIRDSRSLKKLTQNYQATDFGR